MRVCVRECVCVCVCVSACVFRIRSVELQNVIMRITLSKTRSINRRHIINRYIATSILM